MNGSQLVDLPIENGNAIPWEFDGQTGLNPGLVGDEREGFYCSSSTTKEY
jgi:hypothetical protein